MKGDAKANSSPVSHHRQSPPTSLLFFHGGSDDTGLRMTGEAAWRNCQRLQIVHLANTVICLQTRVFRRCYALRTVLAPGCKQFGIQVFDADWN